MGHKIALIGLVLLALVCVGCFDYAEEMVINDDGSGTLSVHIAMDKAYLTAMEKMAKELAQSMGTDPAEMQSPTAGLSRSGIEASLAESGQGIELISFDTSETDAAKIWDVKFAFDDVNKAHAAMAALQADEADAMYADEADAMDEDEEEPPAMFVQQADGTWLFERKFDDEDETGAGMDDEYQPDGDSEGAYADDSDEDSDEDVNSSVEAVDSLDATEIEGMDEFAEGMEAMMSNIGNHTVRMTVKFPGTVIESNATSVDGRTATWEYKLADMSTAVTSMRAVVKK